LVIAASSVPLAIDPHKTGCPKLLDLGITFGENRHLLSDMKPMSQEIQVPTMLERVRLAKSNARYLVVAVNGDRKTLELISMDGVTHLLEDVPFSAVRCLKEPENDTTIEALAR
jgi:hypothetical protein